NVEQRMQAFGFQTITIDNGNDIDAIGMAIEAAKRDTKRPTFITVKTEIGYGCPAKQGKASAHGEPLGKENIAALRETLNWPYEEPFYVPEEVYENYGSYASDGADTEAAWNVMFAAYCEEYPELESLWNQYHDEHAGEALLEDEAFWKNQEKPEATRSLSGSKINYLKNVLPNLVGGSADLAPSNKTAMSGAEDYSAENRIGRNLHFGVRELSMTAIGNGIMLYGGLRAYVATFFVFSDYCKPMARLSSLMGIPLTYVFTHDSIGVGEDGPTHEPIEQLAVYRAMPNFHVFRPCDGTETAAAWYSAITSAHTPTALVLTRQNLEPMPGSSKEALKGGYIIDDCEGTPEVILIASGSEVSLSVKAKAVLSGEGMKVRVVSMPCMDLFEEQSEEYKNSVLPKTVRKRVAVEALSSFGWGRYVGLDGTTVTMQGFGASAPAEQLFEKFGFTVEHVVEAVKSL
ncbi:MAG: transketolase, partial [Clostridium sp.]